MQFYSTIALDILDGSMLYLAQNGESGDLGSNILTDITTQKIIQAAIALLVAYLLVAGAEFIINWIAERVPRRFRLAVKQSVPIWKGVILMATIVYLFQLFFDLSQENLIALTGTVAVALGFAFKDYVSSIIAGIVALFEAPYRVGDRVKIGDDNYGEVVSYGLRSIRLQTPSDSLITVPHSKIWQEAVTNVNSGNLEAQVVTNFYFAHETDVEQVMRILYQTAYSSKYTQLNLPVAVIVSEEPWGTHFKLKAYPIDARDEFIFQTDLVRRAKQAFAKVQLNYPQHRGLTSDRGD